MNRRDLVSKRAGPALLWAIVAYVVLQLGLGAAIQTGLVEPYKTDTYLYRANHVRIRVERESDCPFVFAMVGSSRVMNGFKGSVLEEPLRERVDRPAIVANFGARGAGHIYSCFTLKQLVKDGIRPDFVLIELFPLHLSEHFRLERQWLDQNGSLNEPERPTRAEEWLYPWYTHRSFLVYALTRTPQLLSRGVAYNWKWKRSDISGWVQHHLSHATPSALRHQQQVLGAGFKTFCLGGPSCYAVREMLAFCRSQHIHVGLIWLPEGSAMRGWYSPDMEAEFRHFVSDLQREYSVPFVNARDWVGDECFVDAVHLNACGAELFTQRLAKELPTLIPSSSTAPHQLY